MEAHVVSTSEYAHQSISHAESFRILGSTTITATTEKTVLILINNGDQQIGINRITTSIQGESTKPVTIRIYIGNAIVSAGGSVANLVNVNIGSTNLLPATGSQNNPTIGGTDSLILSNFMEITSIDREIIDGGIVLSRNSSIRITCEGFAGAAGTFNCHTTILLWGIEPTFHTMS